MTESAARPRLVALAGQQNAGKSTLFNALTGVAQHIANYPGVTVDKKSGWYAEGGFRFEVVDLPGTYSLTSFSLEERVVRRFFAETPPDVVVNVVDATNLRRGFYLTAQLLECGMPLVLVLNMMDVARRRGLDIDLTVLEARLGVPVVASVGRRSEGREALRRAIVRVAGRPPSETTTLVDYGSLSDSVDALAAEIGRLGVPAGTTARGAAVKLLEHDEQTVDALTALGSEGAAVVARAARARAAFEARSGRSAADHVAACRDSWASELLAACLTERRPGLVPLSERADRIILNRLLAPLFLILTIWAIYELSIVQGYELTKVTWPILAGVRNLASEWLPAAGFLHDPQTRALGLWMVDSANTLLNYVPIFLILFALIAILEDTGYMARIAFILDRVLHRFGLHGQSTLPFILAGVFAGGCAVPGVMATKGIPDERARMATILTVPFMNCLAKIPLYTLLINIYFAESKGLILFYLSTVTVLVALLVAKLLSVSVLRDKETAPFVMEMPHYHLPTVSGVARRAVDRTWLYVKKVGTVVVAVSVVVYVLLQFPGLDDAREAHYADRAQAAIGRFHKAMEGNPLAAAAADRGALVELMNVYAQYKAEKLNATGADASQALDKAYADAYPAFVPFLMRGGDAASRTAARALKTLADERKTLRREMKEERIVNSFLGQIGRGIEPVTRFAGFDWKVNVALLSSFAARESSVATLGVLFESADGETATLEERMGAEGRAAGYTALGAVAVMLFFALYPPCLATTIMVRVQTQSYRWMLFSILFPTALGLGVASLVFTAGGVLGLTGLQAITGIYLLTVGLFITVGLLSGSAPHPLPASASSDDSSEAAA